MKIDVSATGLNDLVAHLDEVPDGAHRNLVKATEFSANGIKKSARRRSSGIAHAPLYPYTITYDIDDRGVGDGVSAEIGPDPEMTIGGGPFRTPGRLDNILEFGSPNSAPIPHLYPSLDEWAPDWEKGLGKAAADALEGRT
ncbi:hypothetical protein PSN13_06502 [Micromonospora saelicesensis]|uniref:HK97 gp10 family phage protein n=1 Tax=Micromonospora saelicesensis TaxID=285676 RepID=A0A328NIW8_9ACTN|nr:hypothetical protein [Micromonospora saelicesensis]RAO26474.1 hypothetical protein PSN13_06502 [Micromonospora saelicesensis]